MKNFLTPGASLALTDRDLTQGWQISTVTVVRIVNNVTSATRMTLFIVER